MITTNEMEYSQHIPVRERYGQNLVFGQVMNRGSRHASRKHSIDDAKSLVSDISARQTRAPNRDQSKDWPAQNFQPFQRSENFGDTPSLENYPTLGGDRDCLQESDRNVLGEHDRNVTNVNLEICQKTDPLSTDRLAGEKEAFWNSDRDHWMPPKADIGLSIGRDADSLGDRENLESDARLGLADVFGDLGNKPSPTGGFRFNQFMKSKNHSACKNGNFFVESTGLDVESFEGQEFGFENQENSDKKSVVVNLQNRDG